MPLILAVLLVILVEISLFVTVGGAIGLLATLAIILGTGVLGGFVLRAQGQKSLGRMMDTVTGPRGALAEAGDGILVVMAGILLILPGFLSDVAGLVLLVPPIRRAILQRVADRLRRNPANVTMHVVRSGQTRSNAPRDPAGFGAMSEGDIIEGEVLDPLPNESHLGRPKR